MQVQRLNGAEATGERPLFGIEPDKIALIRSTIADGATADELKLFLYHCSRTALDPLAKQIYFQKRFNKRRQRYEMTVITGIDGYRLVADRTGQYAGNDDPVFDDEADPKKATVTVYKIIDHTRCPFTASARWDQYYPGEEQGFMWRKMPHLMLGKCAEALALRKAFPAELSGLYIKEEMDQADQEVTSAPAIVAAPPQPPAPSQPSAPPAEEPPADVYTGSERQRTLLRQAFQRHGLANRAKHAIAAAMQGRPMATLEAVIQDHLKQNPAGAS
jgi:phage recombination protein Bet